MTHTPPSEAAASSTSPYLDPDVLRANAKPDGAAESVRVLSAEVLRLRAQCPPTAEVEKMRADLAQLRRDMLACANVVHPSAVLCGGIAYLEFIRLDVPEEVRKLRDDRDAWKHRANRLGGDLNRIRSLVPTASDEQSTLDAVTAYLAKVHKERDASSKALFDVAIALEEADGGRSGTYENGPPRIRAIAAERDTLREAIGLMTTAKPDMLVDVRDPVGMAQQVVAMVGRLKKDCLANFDASNEQKKRAEAAESEARRQFALFDRLQAVDAKQQALLNEIARLFPGKGPLLERVRLAAAVADKALAEAFREAGVGSSWASMLPLLERRSCLEPKVGSAAGQPRTEVPVGPDGTGTVVELGEAFRRNLANAVDCLPSDGHSIDATTIKIAIRNLHAAVAELARVVERIRAR